MADAATDAAAHWSTTTHHLDTLSTQIPLAWASPDGRRVGSHVAATGRLTGHAPPALGEVSSALRHTAMIADELSSVARRLDRREDDIRTQLQTSLAISTSLGAPTDLMPGSATLDSPGADGGRIPPSAATNDLEQQLRRIERTRSEVAEQWMTQCRQLAVTVSNSTAMLDRTGLATDRESPALPTLAGGPMWISRAFPHAGLDLPQVRFAGLPSSTEVEGLTGPSVQSGFTDHLAAVAIRSFGAMAALARYAPMTSPFASKLALVADLARPHVAGPEVIRRHLDGMFRFLWDWSAAVAVSGVLGGVLASLGPIGAWLAAPPSRSFADPLQDATNRRPRHPNHAPGNPNHATNLASVTTSARVTTTTMVTASANVTATSGTPTEATTAELATAGVAAELDLTDIRALDRRNRQTLERSLASLSDRIGQIDARAIPAGVDRRSGVVAERASLDEALQATTAVAWALDHYGTPDRPSLLLEFHPEAPDRVVIALGDPLHADRIDVVVPGTGSGASTVATYLSAENELAVRESADPHRLEATEVATIVFLNYAAPSGVVAARRTEAAVTGGAALADHLVALRRANRAARITVTGHSYGSTVAGAALRDNRVDVDAALMLSSPGVLASSADDLDGTTCVAAMTAASDVIGPVASSRVTARHGPDPTNPYFGATVVTTRPGWNLWHAYEGYAAHDQAADAIIAVRRGEAACRP